MNQTSTHQDTIPPGPEADTTAQRPARTESHAEVMLSPRVVDAAAFEQFASALRELIGEAHGQSTALRTASGAAERTGQDLAKAITRAKSRLDGLAKVIEKLSARVDALQTQVDGAGAPGLQAAPTDLRPLVARIEELERRLAEAESREPEQPAHATAPASEAVALEEAARATALEQRLGALRKGVQADLEEAHEQFESIRAQLDISLNGDGENPGARDHATTLNESAAEAETVRCALAGSFREAEQRAGELGSLLDRTGAALLGADEQRAQLEQSARAATEIGERIDTLLSSWSDAEAQANEERTRLEKRAETLEQLAERLEGQIGAWRDGSQTPASVTTLREDVERNLGAMQDLVAELIRRDQA